MQMLVRLLTGFPFLHAFNTVSNLFFTLIRLVVFARLLEPYRYAEIVLLIAVGVYLQPLDQGLGRAGYVALRQDHVGGIRLHPRHELSTIFAAYTVFLTVAGAAVPLFLKPANPQQYTEDALVLLSTLFMNNWTFNLQAAAWALDLERFFSKLSFIRRSGHYLALGLLWLTGSLLLFGIVAILVSIFFHILALKIIARHSPLLPLLPSLKKTRTKDLARHFSQIGTSLLSALSELIVLNLPYVLLAFQFGAGPIVVIFDTIMKIARVAMAGTRVVAEVNLSEITRLRILGEVKTTSRRALLVIVACLLISTVPAAIILFDGQTIFDLLLGHNNIVPPSTFPAIATVIMSSAIYQPVIVFLSFGNFQHLIRVFTLICGIAASTLAAGIWSTESPTRIIWLFALHCGFCASAGIFLADRALKRQG